MRHRSCLERGAAHRLPLSSSGSLAIFRSNPPRLIFGGQLGGRFGGPVHPRNRHKRAPVRRGRAGQNTRIVPQQTTAAESDVPSGSLKRFWAPRGKQLFGSIIGGMKGPSVQGPQCELVAKNISRPIGRMRWSKLRGNFAKSIDGPSAVQASAIKDRSNGTKLRAKASAAAGSGELISTPRWCRREVTHLSEIKSVSENKFLVI